MYSDMVIKKDTSMCDCDYDHGRDLEQIDYKYKKMFK